MKNLKIALIGGTGKSGQYLTQTLLNQKIPFNMLVRNLEKAPKKNQFLNVIHGDATDSKSVLKLVEGCNVVISFLGLGSPPSDPKIFTTSTKNILNAMAKFKIERYIVITGLNVDTPADHKSPQNQSATDWMHKTFPASTKNKQEEYELLDQSQINWTLIRLPMIALAEELTPYNASLEDCKSDKISVKNLVDFVLKHINNNTYKREAPFLFNN